MVRHKLLSVSLRALVHLEAQEKMTKEPADVVILNKITCLALHTEVVGVECIPYASFEGL